MIHEDTFFEMYTSPGSYSLTTHDRGSFLEHVEIGRIGALLPGRRTSSHCGTQQDAEAGPAGVAACLANPAASSAASTAALIVG